ncbi:cytochrome P450 [uncultured Williamsia sp.]|uniref:cytochrome P450 n=1 Tax=uncultured Williamsia sp. TaxID=259311 RepID=UPI002622854B|nr:cytochrome P450 [uncultured Williamsia sp.]
MRAGARVWWNDVTKFWALVRYDDIRFVSSNPALFSSAKGIIIPEVDGEELIQPENLIFTDPPRHRQLRKLISAGFTPRQVALLADEITKIVTGIFDEIDTTREYNFAEDIAAPLPTRLIADMLGAPSTDWEQFRHWSDAIVALNDPDIEQDPLEAMAELYEYFLKLINLRREGVSTGKTDLLAILAAAEVDGLKLTDDDLLAFSFLLLVAGNETTRNLLAFGMLNLIENPDQFALLRSDHSLIPSAIEEMLRYNSPVAHMARTATADVEVGGQLIKEGDRVAMLYGAANRDEDVFGDDAEEFIITRDPNPHIAFGYGEHMCLGAQLARLEARIFFEQFLTRFSDISLVGDITRLRATMVPGVKKMPVRLKAGA